MDVSIVVSMYLKRIKKVLIQMQCSANADAVANTSGSSVANANA